MNALQHLHHMLAGPCVFCHCHPRHRHHRLGVDAWTLRCPLSRYRRVLARQTHEGQNRDASRSRLCWSSLADFWGPGPVLWVSRTPDAAAFCRKRRTCDRLVTDDDDTRGGWPREIRFVVSWGESLKTDQDARMRGKITELGCQRNSGSRVATSGRALRARSESSKAALVSDTDKDGGVASGHL